MLIIEKEGYTFRFLPQEGEIKDKDDLAEVWRSFSFWMEFYLKGRETSELTSWETYRISYKGIPIIQADKGTILQVNEDDFTSNQTSILTEDDSF